MVPLVEYTVFHSLPDVAFASVVFVLSSAVYVLFGFGSNLLALGLLAWLLPVPDAVVLILLAHIPIEVTVMARSWRRLPWRRMGLLGSGAVLGIPVGAYLLGSIDAVVVLGLVGASLAGAGTLFLAAPDRPAIARVRAIELGVGSLSGVLGGMLGIAGPPLILYFQLARFDKTVFRGALMAIFQLMTWVRLASYLASGLITVPRLGSLLLVAPAVAVGMAVGGRLHLSLTEPAFRRLVSVAFVALGVGLIVRAWLE